MALTDQSPDSVGVRNITGGRPVAGVSLGVVPDSDFIQWVKDAQLQTMFDEDGVGRLEYIGAGKVGAKTSDAAWVIQRFFYKGPGKKDGIDRILFASIAGGDATQGVADFVHIYDDRASLTYFNPRLP